MLTLSPSVYVRVLHGGYVPGSKFTAAAHDPVVIADDPAKLAPSGVIYEATEIPSPDHPDARRFEVVKEIVR